MRNQDIHEANSDHSVCVVSIIRLSALNYLLHSVDFSYANAHAAVWSGAELNVAIICSSLPALKGLVQRFFPRFFSSTFFSGSGSSQASSSRRRSKRISGLLGVGNKRISFLGLKNGGAPSNVDSQAETSSKMPGGKRASRDLATYGLEVLPIMNEAATMEQGKIDAVTVIEQELEERSEFSTSGSGQV